MHGSISACRAPKSRTEAAIRFSNNVSRLSMSDWNLSVSTSLTLAASAGSAATDTGAWIITGAVVAVLVAGLFLLLYGTRTGIIARATAKEALRQPIFAMLLAVSLLMLVINTFVPFFSLGD